MHCTLHIGNIFKEGELKEESVRKESLLTAADGKNYRTKIYNLDVIISALVSASGLWLCSKIICSGVMSLPVGATLISPRS